MKLQLLIIEHFIPSAEAAKVRRRATFDEDEDRWVLAPLALSDIAANKPGLWLE